MAKLLSAFVGVLMFGLASVASAAQPLSDDQLDSVAAGGTLYGGPVGIGTAGIGNTQNNGISVGLGALVLYL
jgi:hypothetical protein